MFLSRNFLPLVCVILLSTIGCPEDTVSSFMGPNLLVNSPLTLGESPVGVRQRGRLVITNGGDGPLKIDDFQISPDDGIFLIGIEELPLTIAGRRSKDLIISFRPRAEKSYRAELTFSSNHDGNTLDPVILMGTGTSNLVCLPCEPPPEPECSQDGTTSIVYIPTTSTTCDSASGFCDYQVIEMPCDGEICDEETGLCPDGEIPTWDAGTSEPVDSGWDPSECGNGILENEEACDDGNIDNGDGCSDTCTIEDGWDCTEEPCTPICGDGLIVETEACDDGNTETETECSYGIATCTACNATCTEVVDLNGRLCGDSTNDPEELCDDGNTDDGDGCSAACTIEGGWTCIVEPCAPICGDGLMFGNEACDDGNTDDGDGCSAACTIEDGWDCSVEPCAPICGDSLILGDEVCDDGNTNTETECEYGTPECTACNATCSEVLNLNGRLCGDSTNDPEEECDDGNILIGDGCSAACTTENGWTCIIEPCTAICGDGLIFGNEACDDGNTDDGDGCSAACTVEDGWDCSVEPCAPICGDSLILGDEVCDDGNTDTETECEYGTPECTACNATCSEVLNLNGRLCGDSTNDPEEECDDGNILIGDGCSAACTTENGWTCIIEPCTAICGDGLIFGNEACDDGNTDDGDGCSAACTIEDGWDCSVEPCAPICGDSLILGDEVCDDGNIITETECEYGTLHCTACNDTCSSVLDLSGRHCGDSNNDPEEECDDGNTNDGDGCSATCTVEDGWDCSIEPCSAICGDEIVIAGEEICDDGNTITETECEYGTANCVACNETCSGFLALTGRLCGDNTKDPEEVCDDGDTETETACPYGEDTCTLCSENCMQVLNLSGNLCGDTFVTDDELCDDGNNVTETECDYGILSCTGCRGDCSEELSLIGSYCTDGIKDAQEECDDGNSDSDDGCSPACTTEDGWDCTGPSCEPICGDGQETGGEVCDDGNAENETECDYGTPNCSTCNSTCSGYLTLTGRLCGDDTNDPEEVCDDGNVISENVCPYGEATCNPCSSDCMNILSLTGNYCGDDTINGPEICDDGNTITETECDYGTENCAACNADCSSNLALVGRACGDGITDPEELCDDGNTATELECDYGTESCSLCSSTCAEVLNLSGRLCGDGIVDPEEECDDGANGDDSDGCFDDCTELKSSYCGDGEPDPTISLSGGAFVHFNWTDRLSWRSPFTIEGWFYTNSAGDNAIWGGGDTSSDGGFVLRLNGANQLAISKCLSSTCKKKYSSAVGTSFVGRWTYFAVTNYKNNDNNAVITFYVDDTENIADGSNPDIFNPNVISGINDADECDALGLGKGRCGDNTPWNGSFDNIRFWDHALSSTEIAQSKAGTLASSDGLLASYSMVVSGTTLLDDTGDTNLTGTLIGNAEEENSEVCDDGNNITETECPYGFATCIACNADCTEELSLIGSYCGDNINDAQEVCDDGNNNTETECPYGTLNCTLCNADCTEELILTGAACGDSVIGGMENCDDGNTENNDGCSAACMIENGWECTGLPSICDFTFIPPEGAEICEDAPGLYYTLNFHPATTHIVSGTSDYGYGNNETASGCTDLSYGTDNFSAQNGEEVFYKVDLGYAQWFIMDIDSQDDVDITAYASKTCSSPTFKECTDEHGRVYSASGLDNDEEFEIHNYDNKFGTTTYYVALDAWCDSDGSTSVHCPRNGDRSLTFSYYIQQFDYCGDGLVNSDESCDDGYDDDGDGCDSSCDIEPGYTCSGEPSLCSN